MKAVIKKFSWLAVIAVVISGFTSCKQEEDECIGCGVKIPFEPVTIMKLKRPEYKDYILASRTEGYDSISAYYYSDYSFPLGKSGYSPYWELQDDWLLVDWKWGNYPNGNVLLKNEPWEKCIHNTLQTWPLDVPYVSKPIVRKCCIEARSLAEYCNKNYNDILGYIRCPSILITDPEEVKAEGLDEIAFYNKMDSIWTILQNDLSTLISNGDMEKIDSFQNLGLGY